MARAGCFVGRVCGGVSRSYALYWGYEGGHVEWVLVNECAGCSGGGGRCYGDAGEGDGVT
jgi:hypothetical protein